MGAIAMRQARPKAGSVVTLYDVASMAGVSTATVSRVVHGQDRVRESTRARVLAVIEELGYVPDGAEAAVRHREHEPALLRRDPARRRNPDPPSELVAADHLPGGRQ